MNYKEVLVGILGSAAVYQMLPEVDLNMPQFFGTLFLLFWLWIIFIWYVDELMHKAEDRKRKKAFKMQIERTTLKRGVR